MLCAWTEKEIELISLRSSSEISKLVHCFSWASQLEVECWDGSFSVQSRKLSLCKAYECWTIAQHYKTICWWSVGERIITYWRPSELRRTPNSPNKEFVFFSFIINFQFDCTTKTQSKRMTQNMYSIHHQHSTFNLWFFIIF